MASFGELAGDIDNAAGLLLALHGRLLRGAAMKTGEDFQGLAAAGSWLRRKAGNDQARKKRFNRVAKQLRTLDDVTGWLRHATSPRVTRFAKEVTAFIDEAVDTVDDMYKDDAEKVDVEAPSTGVVSNNGVAASVKPKIGKDTVTSSPPDVRSILQVLGTKAAAAAEALVELKAQPLQPPPLTPPPKAPLHPPPGWGVTSSGQWAPVGPPPMEEARLQQASLGPPPEMVRDRNGEWVQRARTSPASC